MNVSQSIGTLASCLAFSFAPTVVAQVPYQFQIDVSYEEGGSGIGGTASPDTGRAKITNLGPSKFTGTLGGVGTAGTGGGGVDVNSVFTGDFNPGDTLVFFMGDESSNQGGFNGPFSDLSQPQDGIKLFLLGTVSFGSDSEAVDLSIFDKDIHSGVVRENPFGVSLDNYILQGGDPYGRDTVDPFEESQAPATVYFQQIPEPSTAILASLALLGLASARRR